MLERSLTTTVNMEDLLVIGGGPAGAACALWAHQLGMRTLLLESGRLLGGLQRRSPYPNLWVPGVHGRTGQELAAQLQAHLGIAGVPYVTDSHVRSIARCHSLEGWQVECSFQRYQGRRLVIATGTLPKDGGFSESPTVGIGPGLSMERIEIGGKRVAILGGGDNAFDQARFALRRGARTVDIYCRREPRAQSSLRRDFPPQHVHVGPFKADQRTMTVNHAPYDVFGVQFGFVPTIPGDLQLPLRNGFIDVDRQGRVPGLPGIYAAGEVTNYWHPCVTTSYAQGIQVAKSIHHDLAAADRRPPRHAPERARSLSFNG